LKRLAIQLNSNSNTLPWLRIMKCSNLINNPVKEGQM